ncbi:hypothetical protein [Rossellomorea marisflavi]|nr:hypothetical protein [Rossellomorea marisflavi]
MDKNVEKFVPVMFQKINKYESEAEDTRFLKVKIWLMHTEDNLNGSYFSKESVEKAIPSLSNTPILAYIEENEDNESDFSDHRMVLAKKDGEFNIKYIGQAIGVIPSENNAQFEMRLCDDGKEREFLTVDGLVWQKWDDPIDIFNRNSIKAQSMELHSDYKGEWNEETGLFHFTDFSFYGACALGKDIQPAMHSATIEAQFSSDKVFNHIQKKMEQFKELIEEKGGTDSMDEKLKLLSKYSITEETLKEKELNIEDYSIEDLEVKLKEIADETAETTDFTLTGEQFATELENQLRSEKIKDDWDWEYSRYSYLDYKDQEVYAIDRSDDRKIYGFSFTVEGDAVKIDFDSKKRKKVEFVDYVEGETAYSVTTDEISEYEIKVASKKVEDTFTKDKETVMDNYSKLEKEVVSLREFKEEKIAEERTVAESELFENFSSELTEEEMSPIKESSAEYSIEELEGQLYALVGKKKASFAKQAKKEKKFTKIPIEEKNDEPKAYNGVFERYLGK